MRKVAWFKAVIKRDAEYPDEAADLHLWARFYPPDVRGDGTWDLGERSDSSLLYNGWRQKSMTTQELFFQWMAERLSDWM